MKKNIILVVILVAIVVAAFLFIKKADKAEAGPTYFLSGTKTADATTTVSYMTPGNATTTLTLTPALGATEGDEYFLFAQSRASSSDTTFHFLYQASMDGVDWYNVDEPLDNIAWTSMFADHASTSARHRWTPGATTTSATSSQVFRFPGVASNFKRVVVTIPIGGNNGTFWGQLVPNIKSY